MHADHKMTEARQLAELDRAEAKALDPHYMPDMLDDMAQWADDQALAEVLSVGRMQAAMGVAHV